MRTSTYFITSFYVGIPILVRIAEKVSKNGGLNSENHVQILCQFVINSHVDYTYVIFKSLSKGLIGETRDRIKNVEDNLLPLSYFRPRLTELRKFFFLIFWSFRKFMKMCSAPPRTANNIDCTGIVPHLQRTWLVKEVGLMGSFLLLMVRHNTSQFYCDCDDNVELLMGAWWYVKYASCQVTLFLYYGF